MPILKPRYHYIHLPKVRVGDVILTRGPIAPIAWATGGPFTHAELAVSRLIRFESVTTDGARFRKADIFLYRNQNQRLVAVERIKTRALGLLRLNWAKEFEHGAGLGLSWDFKDLFHSLMSSAIVMEHGKIYPELPRLLKITDVIEKNPRLSNTKKFFGAAAYATLLGIDWALRIYNRRHGEPENPNLLEMGAYCSKTVLDIVRGSAGYSRDAWSNTDVSPNEIRRMEGFAEIKGISEKFNRMKLDKKATMAAHCVLDEVISVINEGRNRRDNRLTRMLADIEHYDPTVYNAAKDFVMRVFEGNTERSAQENFEICVSLWEFEERLLGPHPDPHH